MSVEITLYAKRSTRTKLIKLLLSEGFKKTRHLLPSLNSQTQFHFMWFNEENNESSAGVEASVYMASEEEKSKFDCTDWILHTRTRASGSYEDKKKQNEVIRSARRLFGGSFHNDWYGVNRYTDLKDYHKFTPLEKGISSVAENSLQKLHQIRHCLSGYRNVLSDTISNIEFEDLRESLVSVDPSVILYNSLMPFLVSIIEYFYGQCFALFLKYDPLARGKMAEEKLRIGVEEVMGILQKESSLEQVVTKTYNFQNLESINRTYKKYLLIDVLSILSVRKKVNNRILRIAPALRDVLERRHSFVHELNIDYQMTKERYLDYVGVVEATVLVSLKSFGDKGLTFEQGS